MSDLDRFKQLLVGYTHLSPRTVETWTIAEGGGGGRFNFLNVKAGGHGGGVGYSGVPVSARANGFADFSSVDDAARETAYWIMQMPNYAGIRGSAGKPVGVQLAAIARSPWDERHYGGNGQNLLSVYKRTRASLHWVDVFGAHIPIGFNTTPSDFGLPGNRLPFDTAAQVPGAVAGAALSATEKGASILVKGLVDVAIVLLAAAFLYTGVRKLTGDSASPLPPARLRQPQPAGLFAAAYR